MICGRRLQIESRAQTEFVDVTASLQAEVAASGLIEGRVFIASLHTTFGLAVNENEPLLLSDLSAALERVGPSGAEYQHDDFSRRVNVPLHEPANGHSHVRHLFLQPSLTLLVEGGRLLLGRWQSVFAVELDGPRPRELALQLDGNFEVPVRSRDRELLELELGRQLAVDAEAVELPMRRLVEAGGKRVRPVLVMICSRLGSAHDPLRAATLAAAVELIHDATLVHDDYVDEASTRRGRATVAASEGPERAIAVGDYYFAKATRVIAELGQERVSSTVARAMEMICLSQIEDVQLRGRYPGDHSGYLRVVRGKTAALIEAACVAAAQLSGASEVAVRRLARFGDKLGIAFQMADDLLDYSSQSGKPAGQDVRQRVLSLPLIYATEDGPIGTRLRRLLDSELDDEVVDEVQRLVVASGALERVADEARELIEAALEEIAESVFDPIRSDLTELARTAVDRAS
ncbi:MAG TPA: secondary thiamine-phosphate synthase enzyme YjbQ [Candidatus Nitrosotalea sp.]|nr:secondary thiamine-phosphate synthase enzyme YjbQ [Candidatus Nitrosotalea sp.]